jgi:hypothetical protein
VVEFDEEQKTLSMKRGEVMLVCNFSNEDRTIPVAKDNEVLLSSRATPRIKNSSVTLQGNTVVVLRGGN